MHTPAWVFSLVMHAGRRTTSPLIRLQLIKATSAQEYEHRFAVWLDNLDYIVEYNAEHTSHWVRPLRICGFAVRRLCNGRRQRSKWRIDAPCIALLPPRQLRVPLPCPPLPC